MSWLTNNRSPQRSKTSKLNLETPRPMGLKVSLFPSVFGVKASGTYKLKSSATSIAFTIVSEQPKPFSTINAIVYIPASGKVMFIFSDFTGSLPSRYQVQVLCPSPIELLVNSTSSNISVGFSGSQLKLAVGQIGRA